MEESNSFNILLTRLLWLGWAVTESLQRLLPSIAPLLSECSATSGLRLTDKILALDYLDYKTEVIYSAN